MAGHAVCHLPDSSFTTEYPMTASALTGVVMLCRITI